MIDCQESTETLLDYTYRTDTEHEEEEEPTTTPKAYTEETQEQNTRATRQKTRRNYKDDANGRPAAQERKKENPAKEKRTDANKTKILLLENTIKQMRLKAAAVDKTRIAETHGKSP